MVSGEKKPAETLKVLEKPKPVKDKQQLDMPVKNTQKVIITPEKPIEVIKIEKPLDFSRL